MTAVTYIAKRELSTGHVVDTAYTIDLRCADIAPGKDVGKKESRSMSGNTETVIWRNLSTRQVTTAALVGGERELALEFLESVIGGETFQFDEFGRAGAPDIEIDAVLDGIYREQRAVRQGDGGRKDYFRYTFTLRQLP